MDVLLLIAERRLIVLGKLHQVARGSGRLIIPLKSIPLALPDSTLAYLFNHLSLAARAGFVPLIRCCENIFTHRCPARFAETFSLRCFAAGIFPFGFRGIGFSRKALCYRILCGAWRFCRGLTSSFLFFLSPGPLSGLGESGLRAGAHRGFPALPQKDGPSRKPFSGGMLLWGAAGPRSGRRHSSAMVGRKPLSICAFAWGLFPA